MYTIKMIICIIVLSIFNVGCSLKPVKMYDGDPLPETKVSTILYMSPSALVGGVDGELVPSSVGGASIGKVFVKPGLHTFDIGFNGSAKLLGGSYQLKVEMTGWSGKIKLNTKAGHKYIFKAEKNKIGEWLVYGINMGKEYPDKCFETVFMGKHSKFKKMGCDALGLVEAEAYFTLKQN
jgi:hypothetical protein